MINHYNFTQKTPLQQREPDLTRPSKKNNAQPLSHVGGTTPNLTRPSKGNNA